MTEGVSLKQSTAPKHIGIVGVSAEGAALCYRTICQEAQATLGRHMHPEVSMHTFSFSDYIDPVETGHWEEVGRKMLASAEKLKLSGADFVICPDNTVHQGLDLVRDHSPLPWLHIAEEIAKIAVESNYRKVGLLGTHWLMEGPVYPTALTAQGIACEIPDAPTRKRIDEIIFDDLVFGRFEPAAREYFQEAIKTFQKNNCDAVILGCTEIPLLIHPSDSVLPVLDSTRTLARAALRHAMPPPEPECGSEGEPPRS